MLVLPFRGKKAVLVPLRGFILKRTTAGALEVPFSVINKGHLTINFNERLLLKKIQNLRRYIHKIYARMGPIRSNHF